MSSSSKSQGDAKTLTGIAHIPQKKVYCVILNCISKSGGLSVATTPLLLSIYL